MTEYDLPPQTQLQQASARPVSGETLETFGKSAASMFQNGRAESLNDAVVATIKHAGLCPEQVKRVVEFTNTHAFISEFKKEGEATKYVSFDHGPASYSDIIKDLNDGGGGSVFDRGSADYTHTPDILKKASAYGLEVRNRQSMQKIAGVEDPRDRILEDTFKCSDVPIPYTNPYQEVEEIQSKLATVRDAAVAGISELEVALIDINRDLYHQVKQAAMDGVPLGHVVQAWLDALDPDDVLVKSAFAIIGPQLKAEGILSYDQIGESLEKTAGSLQVNENHPIVTIFGAYCEALTKIAELRATHDEVVDGLNKIHIFRKLARKHVEAVQ